MSKEGKKNLKRPHKTKISPGCKAPRIGHVLFKIVILEGRFIIFFVWYIFLDSCEQPLAVKISKKQSRFKKKTLFFRWLRAIITSKNEEFSVNPRH